MKSGLRTSDLRSSEKPAIRRFATAAPSLLMLVSISSIRPAIFGENYSLIGVVAAVLAAMIAFAHDKGKIHWPKSSWAVIVLISASYMWLLARSSSTGNQPVLIVQGGFIMITVLLCGALVVGDSHRLSLFVKGFVFVVIAVGISYLITTALWFAQGTDSGFIGSIQSGTVRTSVFFPITVTSGTQQAFGTVFNRLTGIGREPGWMSMFAAVAWFLWPQVGRPRWWGRLAILVCVLAPFSTAGFGVFVVMVSYDLLIKPRAHRDAFLMVLRQAFGLALLGFAVWLAVAAPVFGLAAKATQNLVSLTERNAATSRGLAALAQFSLGGAEHGSNAAINLIASIAPFGWPFALLVVLVVIFPRINSPDAAATTAPIGIILLTLVLAQPPIDSIGVYLLVITTYALASRRPAAGELTLPALDTSRDGPLISARLK